MQFSERMELFGESIFTTLAKNERGKKKAEGETVIDLSIGTPNIPLHPIS